MLTKLVDATAATDSPCNCLMGPYLPFSLVRLGPANPSFACLGDGTTSTTGYVSQHPIQHFVHTRVAGTGGGGRYGNVGVMPFCGARRQHQDPQQQDGETGEPGYYRVRLQPSGIRAELTSTDRCGVHRYTFPAGAQARVSIDASAVLQTVTGMHEPGRHTGTCLCATVEWTSDTECCGSGTFVGGWGHAFPYSVHFYARFDRPVPEREVYTWEGPWQKLAAQGRGARLVAGLGQPDGPVGLAVGVSYVSVGKARASLDREVGAAGFDEVRQRAAAVWEETLGRIRVDGDDEQRRLFYSYLYRLHCMPTDLGVDDECSYWQSGVRQFTDLYCLWDSVRNANSFLMLIEPQFSVDLLNCQLDTAHHTGWLADAWIAGHSAQVQGGSSSDILFNEARWKGLEGIDYADALKCMRKNAEVESPDPWLYGRYLPHYRDCGWVPSGVVNCVSRHLEYSYQDWCIGHLAEQLGEADTAATYKNASAKLWNLWRADHKAFGPKDADGNWVEPWTPTMLQGRSWLDPNFYEASGRQWLWNAHHDFHGLIERLGGPEAFVEDLDTFVTLGMEGERAVDRFTTKETMLHAPWLYHYAGRPDLSARRVRTIMAHNFFLDRNGLRDNEDMGCQSAFLLCGQLGLYPIMGQDHYLLTAPVFERVEMDLRRGGEPLVLEHPGAGQGHTAVASLALDGQPLERAYVHHHELVNGGVLRYETAAEAGAWGTRSLPPNMV